MSLPPEENGDVRVQLKKRNLTKMRFNVFANMKRNVSTTRNVILDNVAD